MVHIEHKQLEFTVLFFKKLSLIIPSDLKFDSSFLSSAHSLFIVVTVIHFEKKLPSMKIKNVFKENIVHLRKSISVAEIIDAQTIWRRIA